MSARPTALWQMRFWGEGADGDWKNLTSPVVAIPFQFHILTFVKSLCNDIDLEVVCPRTLYICMASQNR
jgi:hypothetical protein